MQIKAEILRYCALGQDGGKFSRVLTTQSWKLCGVDLGKYSGNIWGATFGVSVRYKKMPTCPDLDLTKRETAD